MACPQKRKYLESICSILRTHWPKNRTLNVVCHGHSVPSGYFATPFVDTFNAYPHLLHRGLKERFPYAVCNVIVTAIGGENSQSGADRFADEVLCHRPDLITIDYGLNDRGLGLEKAEAAWSRMIESALVVGAKVILLTPTPDMTQHLDYEGNDRNLLVQHAEQIRALAAKYSVGLADSFQACLDHASRHDLLDLLSWSNHPNRKGHELVTREILRWFPPG